MAQDGGVDPHGFHRTRFSRPVPEPSGVILHLVPGGRIELPSAESKSAVLTAAPARLVHKVRFELTYSYEQRVLSPPRLPFRHLCIWWAGLDLNQQCFRCSGFTDRLLQPICIPTHVVTSAGFEPGIAAVKGLCPDRSDEKAVSAL